MNMINQKNDDWWFLTNDLWTDTRQIFSQKQLNLWALLFFMAESELSFRILSTSVLFDV